MEQTAAADRFVGIDVSESRVDAHVRPDGTAFACTTNADQPDRSPGRAAATPDFHGASRGYEGVIAAPLVEAGLPIAIVNLRQVRKFAGAIGRLAKTDAIDSGVIAPFADATRPVPTPRRRLRWKCRRVAVLETKVAGLQVPFDVKKHGAIARPNVCKHE